MIHLCGMEIVPFPDCFVAITYEDTITYSATLSACSGLLLGLKAVQGEVYIYIINQPFFVELHPRKLTAGYPTLMSLGKGDSGFKYSMSIFGIYVRFLGGTALSNHFFFTGDVIGKSWYCWWFRNPAPPFGCIKLLNPAIFFHINWWVYRISEPSTVGGPAIVHWANGYVFKFHGLIFPVVRCEGWESWLDWTSIFSPPGKQKKKALVYYNPPQNWVVYSPYIPYISNQGFNRNIGCLMMGSLFHLISWFMK